MPNRIGLGRIVRIVDLEIQTRIQSGDSQWLFVLPVNEQVHDGKRVRVISESYARRVQEQTEAMYAEFRALAPPGSSPYALPILRDHNPDVGSLGLLREFKLASKPGRNGMWIRVDYTPSGRNAVKSKKLRYVSVRIIPEFVTQRGKVFGPVVSEVSLTHYPRVQSLGEISDTAGMALSMIFGEKMKNAKQLLALIALLMDPAIQADLEELKTVLEEADAGGATDPPGEGADPAALAASITEQVFSKLEQRFSGLNLSQRTNGGAGPGANAADPLEFKKEGVSDARSRLLAGVKNSLNKQG